jgi:DNA-binding HxlR family transcriptional regulator
MAVAADVFRAECGTREVLDLLADKWTVLVIGSLSGGRKRHTEIQREIEGVSTKMLTQTLRRLEQDGVLERTIYPVVPPRVEYELTPLGATLITPLRALCDWAANHLEDVEAARAAHSTVTSR